MPRGYSSLAVTALADDRHQVRTRRLSCAHCAYPLICVEQNRRNGTWLGSFLCPRCRGEYLYAYRWGTLSRKV